MSAAPTRSTGARADYMPGLTGLRGIAVCAVVAYHLGYLPGGFLGVDLFFVLSGFLITRLLLSRTPEGSSGLARWWTKRFTRLTPAVAVVVIAVLVAFRTRQGLVLDAIATLTWWQNWHLIAEGVPYWAGSPTPLRHVWSLSIEEQFYLIWPVSLLGLLAVCRRTGRNAAVVVASVAGVLAAASFAWAALLAGRGTVELSRIYFGTDTRAGALLLGCCAAACSAAITAARPEPRTPAAGRQPRGPLLLAAVAATTLVVLTVVATPEQRWVYLGGLLLAAACSLALILVASRPGPLSSAMEWFPLRWLGVRSYAIYLWSWPVQVLLEELDLPRPVVTVGVVVLSLVLAAWSLRLVEDPLRLGRGWARRLRPRRAAWGLGLVAVVAGLLLAGASAEPTRNEEIAEQFERLPDPVVESTTTTTCVPPPPQTPAPVFGEDTTRFDRSTVERPLDPSAAAECQDQVTRVLVVGDSTGRGAVNGLRRLGAGDLEVWDRTELGCGLVAASEDCADWRSVWTPALSEIDPDVVVAYMRATDDLVDGDEPDFTSDEASTLRRSVMTEATAVLGSTGATVVWVLPAAPLERGAFYCDGDRTGSPCDPDWVRRWREDLAAVTASTGVRTLDAQAWVDGRPATIETDRPDGLHFSGPALDEHAVWLADQLRALSTSGGR